MNRLLLTALLILPTRAMSATPDDRATPPARVATLLGGVGNAMGWLGVQGERYVGTGRLALFAGLGYVVGVQERQATGVAVAAGVRAYTQGIRHRGFLELSISQVAAEIAPEGSATRGEARPYGPGLQVGYQYVSRGGFTVLLSGGLAYAINPTPNESHVQSMVGIGFGYTWRRAPSAPPQ